MSDVLEVADLRRQASELEVLISIAEEKSSVVAMMGYKSRLMEIQEKIEEAEGRDALAAEVSVLFDGRPVTGTSAIDAGFAAQALLHFQGVVKQLFATIGQGPQQTGKTKSADLAQLNLKGVATGSFGFVLEEKGANQTNLVKTPMREAMEKAADLFDGMSQPDDDRFWADVDSISPRVFEDLSKFVKHLEKNESTLKANFPDKTYSFDRAAINRAYERISDSKMEIVEEQWVGTLVGFSPIKRTFDFRRSGEHEIISGKFSHQISQDYLERIEGSEGVTLGDTFNARIEISTLRKPDGTVNVKYTVVDFDEMKPQEQ